MAFCEEPDSEANTTATTTITTTAMPIYSSIFPVWLENMVHRIFQSEYASDAVEWLGDMAVAQALPRLLDRLEDMGVPENPLVTYGVKMMLKQFVAWVKVRSARAVTPDAS